MDKSAQTVKIYFAGETKDLEVDLKRLERGFEDLTHEIKGVQTEFRKVEGETKAFTRVTADVVTSTAQLRTVNDKLTHSMRLSASEVQKVITGQKVSVAQTKRDEAAKRAAEAQTLKLKNAEEAARAQRAKTLQGVRTQRNLIRDVVAAKKLNVTQTKQQVAAEKAAEAQTEKLRKTEEALKATKVEALQILRTQRTVTRQLIASKKESSALNKKLSAEQAALNKQTEQVTNLRKRALAARKAQTAAEKDAAKTAKALVVAQNKVNTKNEQLAKSAQRAADAQKKLSTSTQDTDKHFLASIKNITLITAAYMAASTALQTMIDLVISIPTIGMEFQGIEAAYQAVFSSESAGLEQMAFVRQLADEAGLSVRQLAKDYKLFGASAKELNFPLAESQEIFANLAKTGRTLHLETEDMEGIFRAITQIMNKGKVTAEELQNQLGERVPGAVALMAKSMKLSTEELAKQMEQGMVKAEDVLLSYSRTLAETFGGDAYTKATQNLQANLMRVENSWTDFARQMFVVTEPIMSSIVELADEFLKFITVDDLQLFADQWGYALGDINTYAAASVLEVDNAGKSVEQLVEDLTGSVGFMVTDSIRASRTILAMLPKIWDVYDYEITNIFLQMDLMIDGWVNSSIEALQSFGNFVSNIGDQIKIAIVGAMPNSQDFKALTSFTEAGREAAKAEADRIRGMAAAKLQYKLDQRQDFVPTGSAEVKAAMAETTAIIAANEEAIFQAKKGIASMIGDYQKAKTAIITASLEASGAMGPVEVDRKNTDAEIAAMRAKAKLKAQETKDAAAAKKLKDAADKKAKQLAEQLAKQFLSEKDALKALRIEYEQGAKQAEIFKLMQKGFDKSRATAIVNYREEGKELSALIALKKSTAKVEYDVGLATKELAMYTSGNVIAIEEYMAKERDKQKLLDQGVSLTSKEAQAYLANTAALRAKTKELAIAKAIAAGAEEVEALQEELKLLNATSAARLEAKIQKEAETKAAELSIDLLSKEGQNLLANIRLREKAAAALVTAQSLKDAQEALDLENARYTATKGGTKALKAFNTQQELSALLKDAGVTALSKEGKLLTELFTKRQKLVTLQETEARLREVSRVTGRLQEELRLVSKSTEAHTEYTKELTIEQEVLSAGLELLSKEGRALKEKLTLQAQLRESIAAQQEVRSLEEETADQLAQNKAMMEGTAALRVYNMQKDLEALMREHNLKATDKETASLKRLIAVKYAAQDQGSIDTSIRQQGEELAWLEREVAATLAGKDALREFNAEKAIYANFTSKGLTLEGKTEKAYKQTTAQLTKKQAKLQAIQTLNGAKEEYQWALKEFEARKLGTEEYEKFIIQKEIALALDKAMVSATSTLGKQIIATTNAAAGLTTEMAKWDAVEDTIDSLTNTFSSWLMDGAGNFEDFADSMIDVLEDKVQPAIDATFRDMMAGDFSLSGLDSLFGTSTAGDLLSGAGIGAAIGEALGTSGIGSSIGGALGAIGGTLFGLGPGIGSAIGSALGSIVESAFGGSKQQVGGGVYMQYDQGNYLGNEYKSFEKEKSLWRGTSKWKEYSLMDEEPMDAIQEYFNSSEASIREMASALGFDASAMNDIGFQSGHLDTVGKTEEEIEELMNDWIVGIEDKMYAAVFTGQDLNLEDFVQDSESVSEALKRTWNEFIVVETWMDALSLQFSDLSVTGLYLSDSLVAMAGGIEAFSESASYYYDNFFTDAEKATFTQQQSEAAIQTFNTEYGANITDKDSLRPYVESLDLATEAGQEAYTSAMDLASSLVAMSEAQELLLSSTEELYDQAISIREAMDDITGGSLSTLTPQEQLNEAKADFESTLALALAGDTDARDAVAGAGENVLDLSQDYNASGSDYQADYTQVLAGLEAVASLIEAEADAELDGSHAHGLAHVPWDGYKAELHEGEAVIDASTMQGLRKYGINGGSQSNDTSRMETLLGEVVELLELQLDQNEQLGEASEKRGETAMSLQTKALRKGIRNFSQ